ncbi:hypothetical protein BDK61_2735 [Haloarcula quadrata]|uniref:SWIM-type domain-containing protein n=1 Tax=Haloarcula quadrata TaxID=182779 RepID=A0A495R7R0_9EURY|nr:hypothetical protein [Haloarcula quadrata]RKS83353.1 hypothetical protein BDK61_2735 [Haloarcula quadrata]
MATAATADIAALAQLDQRDVAALTEHMDIYADDPATRDEQVAVYNKGTQYIVDPDAGICDCPDMLHRRPDGGCKHLRAVWFARGDKQIPAGVDQTALAEHIDGGVSR